MSDDRPVPPSGAEPTSPLPQQGQTQPIPPGGATPPPPPPSGYPPPGGQTPPPPPPGGQAPPPAGPPPPPPGGQPPPPPSGGQIPPPSPQAPSYGQPAPYPQGGYQQPGAAQTWRNPTYTDYRPGTIPLRPLTMSDVFGGVVTTIRGNLAATLGLGLLVTAIAVVPATALGIWWARSGSFDIEGLADSESAELATAAGSLIPNLAQLVVVLVTAAFMVWVIGQGAIGRRVSPGQVWAATRSRLPAVLGTVILTVLLFGVPFVIFFVLFIGALFASDGSGAVIGLFAFFGVFALLGWIVFVWVKTAFATSAVVLEEAGPLTAIKRSWVLTRGQFWRLFGIRLLAAIALTIISTIITYPVTWVFESVLGSTSAGAGDQIVWGVFAAALGTVLAGILTTPFSAGVDGLLYIDQRMRKEGLDVTLMRAAQGQDG